MQRAQHEHVCEKGAWMLCIGGTKAAPTSVGSCGRCQHEIVPASETIRLLPEASQGCGWVCREATCKAPIRKLEWLAGNVQQALGCIVAVCRLLPNEAKRLATLMGALTTLCQPYLAEGV